MPSQSPGSTGPGPGADEDVGPGPTSVTPLPVEQQLQVLDQVDDTLRRTVAGLGQSDLAGDTLCTGWSRSHVLTHLARNADALGNLVTWATTGVETPAYPSMQARTEDIEAGLHRDVDAVRADLQEASSRFRARAEELLDRDDLAEVRTGSTNYPVPGTQIIWLRLREVVTHHLDLDAGYGAGDVDPDIARRLVAGAVEHLGARPDCPGVTLTEIGAGGAGGTWALAGGGPVVRGTVGALYLWLMRGVEHDLHADAAGAGSEDARQGLPQLPGWG